MKKLVSPVLVLAALTGLTLTAMADGVYQTLPFSQDWTNTGLITTDDDWSGVPGIIGFRGDGLTGSTGTNPQTLTADDLTPVVDVNANKVAADLATFITGGLAEWELTDPVACLNGSGTADAPYMQIHINSTGFTDVTVSYILREIEDGADNSIQQFALQYRTATSGPWTDVPAGYVADASMGPGLTNSTPVLALLPVDANEQPTLQIRIMTTNAIGNDEWTGPDNISITGTPTVVPAKASSWGTVKSHYQQ